MFFSTASKQEIHITSLITVQDRTLYKETLSYAGANLLPPEPKKRNFEYLKRQLKNDVNSKYAPRA